MSMPESLFQENIHIGVANTLAILEAKLVTRSQSDQLDSAVLALARMFAADNPRFDRIRFLLIVRGGG